MKCRWCPFTFLRGGPTKAFARLREHVEEQHRDKVADLIEEDGHLPGEYGFEHPLPDEWRMRL